MHARNCLSVVLLFLIAIPAAGQHEGYYRFPSLNGDTVAFSAEGDLWTVSAQGGEARRLTTHPGQETHPVFSSDGSQIAFAGAYEGGSEVYVMPSTGGLPTRLTWDGGGSRPVAWHPDGRIVYRTRRYSGVPNTQLVLVNPETMERELVPLAQAADATYGDDGTLFFPRLPRQGSNSRWYKGGMAEILWSLAPGAEEAVRLFDYPGTSKEPRFGGGRLYFLSDRGGTAMNVWSVSPSGDDLQAHTDYMEFDVQEHALSGSRIVYRMGADLYRLELDTGVSTQIPISLVSDFDQRRETWEDAPLQSMSSWNVSPDGKLVALVSRGEAYVFRPGGGRRVHVSRDSGVRIRTALFSADGKSLLVLSDKSGEVEWWRMPIDGVGDAVQITDGPAMLRQEGVPSPDGNWLAHADYDDALWLVDLESGTTTRVDGPGASSGTGDLSWSADSRYLAYVKGADNQMPGVYVFDTESAEISQFTTDRFDDGTPAFAANGDWMFFLSDRTFVSTVGSPWGGRAPQPNFDRMTRIYAAPLRADAPYGFRQETELSTDAPVGTGATATTVADADDRSGKPISFGHLDLLRELPVPRGNYFGLKTNGKRLFYLERGNDGVSLMALDIKYDAKPIKVVAGVRGYELAAGGEHLLVRKGSILSVIAASSKADAKLDDGSIETDGWRVPVDPVAEWRQIFVDAWRMHRDYFWDPGMLGVDWEAVRAKYEPMVSRIGTREELSDLQGQMVSELSLLHSNARGGDVRTGDDSDVQPASLGAWFERVEDGFRVSHVLQHDPGLPGEGSPLNHPDALVAAGSVILSVNGESTAGAADMGALLRGRSGEEVRLHIREPGGAERDVLVTAISMRDEFDLRYDEWEYTRRLETESRGDGAIGYVHLRAMGSGNITEWTREFFPVFDRQGLIIDVRHNNGGNIDAWILGHLMHQAWMYFKGRTGDPYWNMHYAFRGHVVVLVDEGTASDGEAFADGFRRLGLGDVIGTRTWGGEVWLTGSNRQVDGGVARASEMGAYGEEGEWMIEGWGVVPDQTVDNLPRATFDGHDAQLEAAIEHLKRLIEEDPRLVPSPPPYPTVVPGDGFPTPWRRSNR